MYERRPNDHIGDCCLQSLRHNRTKIWLVFLSYLSWSRPSILLDYRSSCLRHTELEASHVLPVTCRICVLLYLCFIKTFQCFLIKITIWNLYWNMPSMLSKSVLISSFLFDQENSFSSCRLFINSMKASSHASETLSLVLFGFHLSGPVLVCGNILPPFRALGPFGLLGMCLPISF